MITVFKVLSPFSREWREVTITGDLQAQAYALKLKDFGVRFEILSDDS